MKRFEVKTASATAAEFIKVIDGVRFSGAGSMAARIAASRALRRAADFPKRIIKKPSAERRSRSPFPN